MERYLIKSNTNATGETNLIEMEGSLEEEEELKKEVDMLKQQLVMRKQQLRQLVEKVREAKSKLQDRERKDLEAAKVAKRENTMSAASKDLENLKTVQKIYRIFGVEVVSSSKQGVSATFYQWHKGTRAEKYSIAIERKAKGHLEVTRHSLPTRAVSWLGPVPCSVPCNNISKVLGEIKSCCFMWNYRKNQLLDFKRKHSNVCLYYPINLSTITISPKLMDSHTQSTVEFDIELSYSPNLPYPTNIRVSCNEDKGAQEEENEELVEEIEAQVEAFKSMELTEAFYFRFIATDDTTRRTTLST